MRKSERDSLDPTYQHIRNLAHDALARHGALGILPTPVESLIAAAQLEIMEHEEISVGYLDKLNKKAREALKSALGKVWGVIDFIGKIIHIDKAVPLLKRPFLKLHELGHAILPWQKDIYTGIEDSEQTIHHEITEKFEREASCFATEVLFQIDLFDGMARDSEMSLKSPLALSKKVGASVYATIRRFVDHNHRCCAVLVLEPTEMIIGDGFQAKTRRIVTSPLFDMTFGDLEWPDVVTPDSVFGKFIPLGDRKMAKRDVVPTTDLSGKKQEWFVESFKTKYQTFILIST